MENSNKVVVCATEGQVILVSDKNPEFGQIRVCQIRTVFDETGWARKKKLWASVPGTIEVLQSLNWKEGQELDGKIVIKESLIPFNKKEPDKDLKIAGKSGVICRKGTKAIYLKNIYTESEGACDSPIPHDNISEIREAYAKQNAFSGDPNMIDNDPEEEGEEGNSNSGILHL